MWRLPTASLFEVVLYFINVMVSEEAETSLQATKFPRSELQAVKNAQHDWPKGHLDKHFCNNAWEIVDTGTVLTLQFLTSDS